MNIDKSFELFILDIAMIIATTKDLDKLKAKIVEAINIYRENINNQ